MKCSSWQRRRSSASCINGTGRGGIRARVGIFLIVSGVGLFAAGRCHAGAWTQQTGSALLITTLNVYSTNEYRDNGGDKHNQPRFTQTSLAPYLEYGLADGLTVGGSAYLEDVHQRQAARDNNIGITDPELFARYRLYRDNEWALALQPLVKLPSYYESNALPRSGTRHWDGELAFQAGRNFKAFSRQHFLEADIGYRVRGGPSGNQLRASLTLGMTLSPRWTLMPQLNAIWRTGNYIGAAFTETEDNDFDLIQGELSALYHWREDVDLQIGAFSNLYARDTGLGGGGMVSVWKRF
jgi:hypothetical protein